MQSADGSIINFKKSTTIRVNVKKERKKIRARELLSNAKINFTEKQKSNGYSTFYYKTDIPYKDLSFLYSLPEDKLKNIAEEIIFWDGSNPNVNKLNLNGASFTGNKNNGDAAHCALSVVYRSYVSWCKDRLEAVAADI